MAPSLWGFWKVIEMSAKTKKGHILEREIITEMGDGAQYHLTEELCHRA